jgi:hypothetical protein
MIFQSQTVLIVSKHVHVVLVQCRLSVNVAKSSRKHITSSYFTQIPSLNEFFAPDGRLLAPPGPAPDTLVRFRCMVQVILAPPSLPCTSLSFSLTSFALAPVLPPATPSSPFKLSPSLVTCIYVDFPLLTFIFGSGHFERGVLPRCLQ